MSRKSRRFLGIPDEFWMGFIVMVGFFLKLIYDIQVGYTAQTLNAGEWREMVGGLPNSGQIGVIQYYFTMHRLPDFPLTAYSGFANPPLFYWISAGILEIIHRLIGWPIGTSLHVLQCLNVIYVTIGICCGIGMAMKLGIRGRKLTVTILFLTFFPVFYHLSASLSPDAMCFLFTMLALNTAMSWYTSRRSSSFYKMGVELGLGMMTGFYACLAIPAILTLYYYAGKDGRRNETPLPIQLRRFTVLASVLGLWWYVFRLIRYQVPLFYNDIVQYGTPIGSGYSSWMKRLWFPNSYQMHHFHTIGKAVYESNFWAQLFKTGIFGLRGIEISIHETEVIAGFLLRLSVVLCLLMHLMWIYVLQTARLDRPIRRFLVIGYLSMLGCYLMLALRYPYVEMVNLMTNAPMVMFPVLGMGVCGYGSGNENLFEKITTWLANLFILIFALITAFLMGFYAS